MQLNKATLPNFSAEEAQRLHKNKTGTAPHALPSTITKWILKQKQGKNILL